MYRSDTPGYVVLEDGTVFSGFGFAAPGKVFGEIVFNTGMTGYQEVTTDPSYHGQMVTFTYPMIGNYGAAVTCRSRIGSTPEPSWCARSRTPTGTAPAPSPGSTGCRTGGSWAWAGSTPGPSPAASASTEP